MSTDIKVQFSSESVEWYTPAKYMDAVRCTLGGIELDPASCEIANRTVQAARFFTVETDGLSQEWNARSVFLNPPYGTRNGKSNQGLWSQKLIAEFEAGRMESAILLVNASTSEKWFKPLFKYPICFTDHRIRFNNTDAKKQPTKGNAFVYFGSSPRLFFNAFCSLGTCVVLAQYPLALPLLGDTASTDPRSDSHSGSPAGGTDDGVALQHDRGIKWCQPSEWLVAVASERKAYG